MASSLKKIHHWYDTIRYDIFTCAQKLTHGQLNLAHGTETNNKEKLKTKTE